MLIILWCQVFAHKHDTANDKDFVYLPKIMQTGTSTSRHNHIWPVFDAISAHRWCDKDSVLASILQFQQFWIFSGKDETKLTVTLSIWMNGLKNEESTWYAIILWYQTARVCAMFFNFLCCKLVVWRIYVFLQSALSTYLWAAHTSSSAVDNVLWNGALGAIWNEEILLKVNLCALKSWHPENQENLLLLWMMLSVWGCPSKDFPCLIILWDIKTNHEWEKSCECPVFMAVTTNGTSRGKCGWDGLRLISYVCEFVWKIFDGFVQGLEKCTSWKSNH